MCFNIFAKWKQVLQNACFKVPVASQIPEHTSKRTARAQDLTVKTVLKKQRRDS